MECGAANRIRLRPQFAVVRLDEYQAARDAIDPTYSLDLQTLIALLVAILGLVGLEARDIMRRGDD